MKAFLSHASADKDFVLEVYKALEPHSLWLDRAEIEWGDLFLEKIEEGIKSASDFVIFWSQHSAESAWVKLEINMAFIELIKRKAIRLRIVQLDETGLPLYLEPYHCLSVATSNAPIETVVSELRSVLKQPTQGVRHRFLNRNAELGRIEDVIIDALTKVILLNGFQGIGKGALASEAFRRFFQGASVVDIPVSPGVGPTELALQLHHAAFGTLLPEMTGLEALAAIENSMKAIIGQGRFIVFRNGQYWLDPDQRLAEPLLTIIRQAADLAETSRNPVFITSTRRPRIPANLSECVVVLQVYGLEDDHTASLISLWYEISTGSQLDRENALKVASQLHGHPVAAKIASNLVAQFGAEHLLEYPQELVTLRRDLAKTLLGDLSLSNDTWNLMEVLATISVPVPSRVLVEVLGTDGESFQLAVAGATAAGIAETTDTGFLRVHPLVDDYFWRSHRGRSDYMERAATAAASLKPYFANMSTQSAEFIPLLRALFRLLAMSGDLQEAWRIRGDLLGELSSVAVTHYNRYQYDLAEVCIQEVLEGDPGNWRMRQYLARIRIRQRRWEDADELIGALLSERPRDVVIRHVLGWRLRREERYQEALDIFIGILGQRDHAPSFRDGAECLWRLDRIPDALEFLQRAKQVESDNPYALELEARIYQEIGEFERALAAANVAVVRNPRAWSLRHRRAQILSALRRRMEAVDDALVAVQLGPEQFIARSTLVSLLLDNGQREQALVNIGILDSLSINNNQRHIATHLRARALYVGGDLTRSLELVQRQINRGLNLAPSYGLLVQVKLAAYSRLSNRSLASAQLLLQQAKAALAKCRARGDHDPQIVSELGARIEGYESGNETC